MDTTSIKTSLERVRTTHPLVHNITNYVTVNDCANALLAIDASPIMSDEPLDVGDIQTICGGLVINIGTLNQSTIAGMHEAAKVATELGHPIVLDPVGAGASALRTQTAADLLDAYPIAIVRGNISEIKALANGAASTRGVDVCPDDIVTDENLEASAAFARDFAARTGSVVAITGPIDIVADSTRSFAVRNGSKLQGRITGAGCMLSCITGAFAVANDDALLAALGAVCTTGVAGNLAEERMGELDGNLSFRTYLIDALYKLDGETLANRALVEDVQ
ncbi:MAG: hydroxyethylthiazole kinase [Eggerthellaceae bacterium]|nr:hydroxyethylthiazole kinase [Eggerthellaceae bacterium]